jgi:hypothetical protein
MKKMLLVVGIATSVFACTNETDSTTTTTTTRVDSANNTATSTTTYRASDGDVTYRNGKVLVWRNNDWVDADNDVTLNDGTVVRKDGKAVRNNEERDLEDGVVIDKTGRFFDKAGNTIEDGWQGLKKGVKKGYNETKEEVKDVLDKDEKQNN